MSRIAETFSRLKQSGRKALIPFITAGDPEPEMTVPFMQALVQAGSDIIELGVPFSDPMADGPTIQRSSERALQKGTSLRTVLDMVEQFRKTDTVTPIVLMGYGNPVEAMGYEAFALRAGSSGVDGVLTVDYPPEESEELVACLIRAGIDPIFLLSPTTLEERVDAVAKLARGYVYYVSLKGVTGASHLDLDEVAEKVSKIKRRLGIPVGVGFGIRDAATAKTVAEVADAVVIGSRIVQEIENSPENEVMANLKRFVGEVRAAIDSNQTA